VVAHANRPLHVAADNKINSNNCKKHKQMHSSDVSTIVEMKSVYKQRSW